MIHHPNPLLRSYRHDKAEWSFRPQPPDTADVISWVHLGDLHMATAGQQNHLDLAAIVNEVNQAFAGSVSFAFSPGDIADDGSRDAYVLVRAELDRLCVPWCAIVGDHDVHEKSFDNFLAATSKRTHYAFTVGSVHFVAMNAFDLPDPASFSVNGKQLTWLDRELRTAAKHAMAQVLLLHCYPTDLKLGAGELTRIIRNSDVRLVDMGHTHYNEVANDGWTLYSATRSIGQIEEGPVGYSIINIDGDVVSWRFIELGRLPPAVITSPSDERLLTKPSKRQPGALRVRAKFLGEIEAERATAHLNDQAVPMKRILDSQVWEADVSSAEEGIHSLEVSVVDKCGQTATDKIRIVCGDLGKRKRAERDQDNALEAWPEHGLIGTQLGPNKNGKKW